MDTTALRRETEATLERLAEALDRAQLKPDSATRFAVEILSGTVRHSTELHCTLVEEVRAVEADLAELHERQDAWQEALIKVVHLWGVAIVATIIVLGATTAAWLSQGRPSLAIDAEAGETGVVHCGPGARDAAGLYHCSMDIILKKGR